MGGGKEGRREGEKEKEMIDLQIVGEATILCQA